MMEVISASRVTDGLVVYLTRLLDWAEDFQQALIISDEEKKQELMSHLASVYAGNLVYLYPVKVNIIDGKIEAISMREKIRSQGPSVRYIWDNE